MWANTLFLLAPRAELEPATWWFENTGDEPLLVLWTLNCDSIDDIDFTFIE